MSTPQNSQGFRRSSRCLACRMPVARLDRLHRDRLQLGLTFEALAQNCRADGVALSESSLRRHFRRHVPEDAYSLSQGQEDSPPAADLPTTFDDLIGKPVDERLVLESIAQGLLEKMRAAEQEWQAARQRNPQAADRALVKFVKLQTTLDRSLKRLHEARQPMEEMRKAMDKYIEVAGQAIADAARQFMDAHVAMVRDAVDSYLSGTVTALVIVRRFDEFEREWGRAIAEKVGEAVAERLKATPELRPWFPG